MSELYRLGLLSKPPCKAISVRGVNLTATRLGPIWISSARLHRKFQNKVQMCSSQSDDSDRSCLGYAKQNTCLCIWTLDFLTWFLVFWYPNLRILQLAISPILHSTTVAINGYEAWSLMTQTCLLFTFHCSQFHKLYWSLKWFQKFYRFYISKDWELFQVGFQIKYLYGFF